MSVFRRERESGSVFTMVRQQVVEGNVCKEQEAMAELIMRGIFCGALIKSRNGDDERSEIGETGLWRVPSNENMC